MQIRKENIKTRKEAAFRKAGHLRSYSREDEYFSPYEDAFWVPKMDVAHILLYTAVCFVFLLPWLVVFYPGIMEIDTVFQIAEYKGYGYGYGAEDGSFTNLYPLFDVWLFGTLHDAICTISGGDQRAAVVGMCLLVSMGTSLSTALCSCYMQKWRIPIAARFIPMAMFAFVPAFSLMGIDIGKDTVFCSVFIPFCVCCCELVRCSMKDDDFSAGWPVALTICAIFSSLTASKGIVLVCIPLLTCIVYALVKKSRTAMGGLAAFGSTLAIFIAVSTLIVPIFVDSGQSTTFRELLGTPVQQVSFAVKTGTVLTEKEEEQVSAFFKLDSAVKHYDPAISDHTKNYVRLDAGLDEVLGFLEAYVSIGARAKDAYWQAFSDLYDGYYEIGTYNALLLPRFMPTWEAFDEYNWTSQDNLPNSMVMMRHVLEQGYLIYSFTNLPEYQEEHPDYASWGMYSDGEETRIAAFEYVMGWGSIPGICLLVDKSFYVLYLPLLLLLSIALFGHKKRGGLFVAMVPLVLSSLIAFASPIDFSRYAYPCMMLCLLLAPLVLANMKIRRE